VILAAGSQAGWGELLSLGLNVTAIGMGVVFLVLILLSSIMVLIGRLGGQAGDGAPQGGTGSAGTTDQAAAVPGPEIAAVIAAAVAACTQPQGLPGMGPGGAARASQRGELSWVLSGRIEQVTSRERLSRGRGPGKGRGDA
jgi:sodium pump decarboxylase gamma subunit